MPAVKGAGLLKGLGVTFKTMARPAAARQYPHVNPHLPGIEGSLADLTGPLVLGAKVMVVAFFIFWFRFTFPRLREDQLQAVAWKYLIPVSLVNILATGVLKVLF